VYLDTPRGPVVIAAVSRGVNGSPTACGGGGIYVRTDKLVPWIETTAGVAITKDRCAAQPAGGGSDESGSNAGSSSDVDGDTVTAGCAASNPQGLAPLALIGLALARRRRRRRATRLT
jgi:MYXO-CTERM domain-containing protein